MIYYLTRYRIFKDGTEVHHLIREGRDTDNFNMAEEYNKLRRNNTEEVRYDLFSARVKIIHEIDIINDNQPRQFKNYYQVLDYYLEEEARLEAEGKHLHGEAREILINARLNGLI